MNMFPLQSRSGSMLRRRELSGGGCHAGNWSFDLRAVQYQHFTAWKCEPSRLPAVVPTKNLCAHAISASASIDCILALRILSSHIAKTRSTTSSQVERGLRLLER